MIRKAKIKGPLRTVLAIFIMFAAVCATLPFEANAATVAIEGVSYNVDAGIPDNLKSLIGKKVNVTLGSGKTFSGTVKNVGAHMVHLEKLDGKDFFDALIRVEDISAIDTRFRKFER